MEPEWIKTQLLHTLARHGAQLGGYVGTTVIENIRVHLFIYVPLSVCSGRLARVAKSEIPNSSYSNEFL